MTVEAFERRHPGRTPISPHFTLSRDAKGWTLSRPDGHARRFDTFEAGIDGALEAGPVPEMPIDVWQDGQYICCLPTEQWPDAAPHAVALPKPLFPTIDRHANQVARWLMGVAGPVFWMALVAIALTASLGWRLALL